MASGTTGYQDQIDDWMKSFAELPADRKDAIERWFAVQKVIVEASGLSADEWFRYVQWAMDNPFDYGFIKNFPDVPDAGVHVDSAEKTDRTRDARKLVGGDTPRFAPDGGGLKGKATVGKGLERELFDRFMRDRLGGGKK